MTDDVKISASVQIYRSAQRNGPVALTNTDRRTFAYAECEQVIINDKTVMIINLRNRRKMVVTREVGNALTHCTNFETLSGHATKLCAASPILRDQQADVLHVLESARQAGILTDSEETLTRLNTAPAETRVTPTRVFIITCDRPAAVERLLDSMLAGCDLTHHNQLFLIDDSRTESNASQNRQLVAKFNRNSTRSMLYFGAEAAATLLSQLIAGLPTQERGLRFLLDRERWRDQPTYGLSRNLCLLLSVDYRALVLDDDIVCRAVRSPISDNAIAFSHEESREAWFYPVESELSQHSLACEFDPLARHADALGKPLAAVLAMLHGGPLEPASLDHCNGPMLGVLEGASAVLVTQCGSEGNPGTGNSRWVVNLGLESIARLLTSNPDKQVLPDSQLCWLGHTRTTVSLRGVMSQLTGLDNSQLLPPYAPILRGEDDLFASMTAYLHPHSAILNYNWAVPHLPVDDRSAAKTLQPFTGGPGLSTLAGYLRGKINTHNYASVECRLTALAAEIRALGEYPGDALLTACEVERANNCAGLLRTLEVRLAEARNTGHPGWQNFLQRYLTEAQAILMAPITLENEQLPDWTRSVQDAAIAFSEALYAWQEIRRHSAAVIARMISSAQLLP